MADDSARAGGPPAAAGVVRTFDHLVVAVPDLTAGVKEFEELTGARTVPGGSHPGRGTANHLVPLVPRGWEGTPLTYLEILGPDPAQDPALAARSLPGVTGMCAQRWAAHPDEFDETVANADSSDVDYGRVFDMSRDTPDGGLLEWRLTRRAPLAHGGAQPFLIDWGSSPHPADTLRAEAMATESLAEAPVTLVLDRLEFFGPVPAALREAIRVLTGEHVTVGDAPEPGFRAVISGPRGALTLASVGPFPIAGTD